MLSNQQLYLVNHYALVARRHGIHLPDLKLLLADAQLLRRHVEQGLLPGADAAVAEAAAKVAASMNWRPAPAPASPAQGIAPEDLRRAQAALVVVAGPIASLIVEQIDATDPAMTLSRFLDEAAAMAQLDDTRRRALRQACGLASD